MSNLQNSSRFDRFNRSFIIPPLILNDVDQIVADFHEFMTIFNRLMKNCLSMMKMIREMQDYVVAKRNELNEIFVIAKRIEQKRDVVIIERNETIRKLNEAKTIVRFLQNDLAKQQNQSSTDQFIRSMKIHSSVVISVFIALDASKAVKSAKLSDDKALTDNNENEFEN